MHLICLFFPFLIYLFIIICMVIYLKYPVSFPLPLFHPSTTISSSSILFSIPEIPSISSFHPPFPPHISLPPSSSPSHQECSNGPSGDKPSQDIIPVVSVFSHSHHPHQHGQRQQHQAQGGLGQTGPLGPEHQGHVHLEERDVFEIKKKKVSWFWISRSSVIHLR